MLSLVLLLFSVGLVIADASTELVSDEAIICWGGNDDGNNGVRGIVAVPPPFELLK